MLVVVAVVAVGGCFHLACCCCRSSSALCVNVDVTAIFLCCCGSLSRWVGFTQSHCKGCWRMCATVGAIGRHLCFPTWHAGDAAWESASQLRLRLLPLRWSMNCSGLALMALMPFCSLETIFFVVLSGIRPSLHEWWLLQSPGCMSLV